ncbi:hypothetical protein GCM10009605_21710 [Nocardiopsis composta]
MCACTVAMTSSMKPRARSGASERRVAGIAPDPGGATRAAGPSVMGFVLEGEPRIGYDSVSNVKTIRYATVSKKARSA